MEYFRRVNQFILIIVALIAFQGKLLADEVPLFIYVGAGLRPAMEKLALLFEDREGVKVRIDYGGSGQQLTRFKASHHGDLFVPGSKVYLDKLVATGQVSAIQNIVMHTPVVAIHRDKIKRLKLFSDLTLPGIKIGLGDPKSMALGRSAENILQLSGMAEAIQANTVVRTATVKQLAMYLIRGDVDAAIIGRSDVVQNSKQLEMIEIPKEWYQSEIVAVGLLSTTKQAALAKRFAELLVSPEGVAMFVDVGFLPCDAINIKDRQ